MGLRNAYQQFAEDMHLPTPPFWMVSLVLILVCLSLVPLALAARARVSMSNQPRVHLFQDMGKQPRYNAQDYSTLFEDHRAMRPRVPGTVSQADIVGNDHLSQGYALVAGEDGRPQPQYFESLPPEVEVDERFILRGRDMYGAYCAPCHGWDGSGNGLVSQRAQQLLTSGQGLNTVWVQPANLNLAQEDGTLRYGPDTYEDGRMFNVITNGFNNMPAHGHQIAVHDRWAIVAYVRALQLSQHAPVDLLPADLRNSLR